MIKYVAGFLFSPDFKNVVLIEKNKPNWQKGKYNGIGGKIEDGENSLECMRREFEEEAGLDIERWISYCKIGNHEYSVEFFWATSEKWEETLSLTNEPVFNIPVYHMFTVDHFLIPNLWWLIHLAIDKANNYSNTVIVDMP